MAEVVHASSESSMVSAFSTDWYSPMTLIRSISGFVTSDSTPSGESKEGAPKPCTAEVAEAHKASDSSEEDALRQRFRQTLLDAALSGSLITALRDTGPSASEGSAALTEADIKNLRERVGRCLVNGASSGTLEAALASSSDSWQGLGQSLSTASELLELRTSSFSCAHAGLKSNSKLVDETPRTSAGDSPTNAGSDTCESDITSAPSLNGVVSITSSKEEKSQDCSKRSRQPKALDEEQMLLQATTANLDCKTFGSVQAKLNSSPRKGKRWGSPRKGGS